MKKNAHVVLGVTGSIAAYKACDIVRRLKDQGVRVSVVMTKAAGHFITPLTLSKLSQNRVFTDMFASQGADWDMEHIDLAQSADLLLIAPASANIISKISCGIADDLLTCIALGTRAKIFMAPAMNNQMYVNAIFQENCRKLEKHGVAFIAPVKGKLACGAVGDGHLADVDDIVKTVIRSLKK